VHRLYQLFEKNSVARKKSPPFTAGWRYDITGRIYLFIAGSSDFHWEALDLFEKAILIYESADTTEKGRIVCLHGEAMCIGDHYENRVSFITKIVFCFHEKMCIGAWGPTGCHLSVTVPAGLEYDCCEGSQKDLEEESMLRCGKCKMVYYCSVDCQQKAFKEQGYRLVCRKKGEFKVGDVAVVTESVGGIRSGQQVELIAPVLGDVGMNDESQSWIVKEKHGDERGQVAVKSLKQVRSVLW